MQNEVAVVALSLSDKRIEHVQVTASALGMWTEVMSLFSCRSLLNHSIAWHRFYSGKYIRWGAYPCLTGWIRQNAADLKSIYVRTTNWDLCMTILCSILQRFGPLIVACNISAEDGKLAMRLVESRSLQDKQRMNSHTAGSTKCNADLLSTLAANSRSLLIPTCTCCKKRDHLETVC